MSEGGNVIELAGSVPMDADVRFAEAPGCFSGADFLDLMAVPPRIIHYGLVE